MIETLNDPKTDPEKYVKFFEYFKKYRLEQWNSKYFINDDLETFMKNNQIQIEKEFGISVPYKKKKVHKRRNNVHEFHEEDDREHLNAEFIKGITEFWLMFKLITKSAIKLIYEIPK